MTGALLRVPIDYDDDEHFIEVEVDINDLDNSVDLTAGQSSMPETAPFSLAGSMGRIMPAVKAILSRVRHAVDRPDEVGMVFGLKVGGETGLVFAKGTSEATFVLTLTWRAESKDTGPSQSPNSPNEHRAAT